MIDEEAVSLIINSDNDKAPQIEFSCLSTKSACLTHMIEKEQKICSAMSSKL